MVNFLEAFTVAFGPTAFTFGYHHVLAYAFLDLASHRYYTCLFVVVQLVPNQLFPFLEILSVLFAKQLIVDNAWGLSQTDRWEV
ncbi:hypothetical protein BDP55DRAFT_328884 [Colletotrichum godetiae]|uniref:Uncharacterized protein n=1 Tax=Colletotrichum godetiae TaxID=1209918 RepID=A0AAJ0EPM5_9PEZI|nr:uncharacterized protein BDP55DRAFT_328884 [Colletotrichum godetiae]KAK1659881.1 hypothetical protein BDP55DRAFT_328884 [Colletotrichum godetiae]